MTTVHPNRDLLDTFFRAIEQGNLAAIVPLLAERVAIHVGGRGPLAGDYHGRTDALDLYGRFARLTGPGFTFPPHDALVDDQFIIVLPRDARWRTAGKGMDVYRIEDGKIAEIWVTQWKSGGREPSR
ncbi:MAG TPA: nuclear transport factor 2 family protein [Candidatus Limnocylindrales bacterium]|jgi:ketosteroid isomerase-like protein|nr:nuclear transport factor 2 family protein [Candidatus Limnocylindrales bacterium]